MSDEGDDKPTNGEVEEGTSAEKEVHEWSAFYHDDGNLYYYNETTGESSWDAPEKFNPPPPREDEGENQQEAGGDGDGDGHRPQEEEEGTAAADGFATQIKEESEPQDEPQAQAEPVVEAEEPPSAEDAWVAYKDEEEGREYYFNTVTNETTWDKPDKYQAAAAEDVPEEDTKMEGESPERPQSPVPMDEYPPSDEGEEQPPEVKEEQPVEEKIDSAVQRVKDAEFALTRPDAVMEPKCMDNVTEVVTSQGGNPQKAIQALIESYHGQTAICGLLGLWLADLRTQSTSSDATDQKKSFQNAADDIRQMAQDVVNRVAKERFTKTGGDRILDLKRSEAVFLEAMMDSKNWRKLLIDLSASNKDSALLMYCLQAISKRGHHREIARRVNQSDHFAVFNAMLASELAVVGKIAVSACRDSDTSIGLDELVGDLRRTCTATAYTYIYAIEVLRHLVVTAKETPFASAAEARSSRFPCAIRKWERLTEDLQSAMIDPASSGSSTPLFRKRRLDVALTVSELHQRQRRRLRPVEDDDDDDVDHNMLNGNTKDDTRLAEIETAVLNFLRRYSLGTQVDDRILDAMLPKNEIGGDSSNKVGKLLIKRPLSVKALLGYMFVPGQRVASISTRNKCARLVALAVLAAEGEAVAERQHRNSSQTPRSDEVAVTRTLQQGSALCERLENMVSFLVVTEAGKGGATASPGEQLCALAMKCAPVAQGVVMWARKISSGSEFVTSASYPTVSPSILSMVRIVTLQHPYTRRDSVEVALGFLKHSNSEISYQKMNEIKEQSIRLLLFLTINGEGPTVLERITSVLKSQGNSFMDASLIRYFVGGLLEVVNAPLSVPFVRAMASLLKLKACGEAVRSQYFGDENKQRLESLMNAFRDLLDRSTRQTELTKDDTILVKSVMSAYPN